MMQPRPRSICRRSPQNTAQPAERHQLSSSEKRKCSAPRASSSHCSWELPAKSAQCTKTWRHRCDGCSCASHSRAAFGPADHQLKHLRCCISGHQWPRRLAPFQPATGQLGRVPSVGRVAVETVGMPDGYCAYEKLDSTDEEQEMLRSVHANDAASSLRLGWWASMVRGTCRKQM